ncbi:hypothetical protein Cpap_1008 [Ruminiclostridium papyrosolvens DSM 2782]|uniref:Uncharacterized protein n=1 Tax=Ruminiclostridium papyrosolvens DSM 2782 TaxID=588581 RepID=F1TG07_9FIRM|nr:hypothetical protein [Ruminiclostridium papyrosolvens]EGD46626.1 hypothetical protein Cpap_1008 [Ruminiclostridium papyrosolvens DSM 2782]WES35777.1 hypothetical protein P0092_07360 [Ruminiclostridium papyrosolvens DSM 2782]
MKFDVNELKNLVEEMDLNSAFDNIDAENCSVCCYVGGGGC